MSYSAEALRGAIEFHKKAVEKYKEAVNSAKHDEAREALKKLIRDNEVHIESAQWVVMAEAGELGEDEPAAGSATEAAPENGATKLAAGKCPFSGQFKEMGIDLANFDMSKLKETFKF